MKFPDLNNQVIRTPRKGTEVLLSDLGIEKWSPVQELALLWQEIYPALMPPVEF